MKYRIAFAAAAVLSILFASFANARSEGKEPQSLEHLFLRMDLDHSESIDEAELVTALQQREDRQMVRIATLKESDRNRASKMAARVEKAQSDSMLGEPDAAAAFLIANFDSDGDWELNREEVGQAFSSVRKWRSEGRGKTS